MMHLKITRFYSFPRPLLFTVLVGFLACCGWAEDNAISVTNETLTAKDANTFFAYITERVRRDYVEPISNEKLLEGALNGMLNNLDPHSAYLNPKHFTEIKKQTQGKYGGLGLEIIMEEGLVRVMTAIPDTPASKAGLQTGDTLLAIDDVPIMGMSLHEVAEKLKGEPNTSLKLLIRRHKTEQLEVMVTRDIINIKAVDWRLEGKIGYIRLKTFNKETSTELIKAIQEIQGKLKKDLSGFILDLRNNPGGLLDQAIAVSDTFLSKGEIVSIRGRDTEKISRFSATPGDATQGLPIVILINGGSASASEIVAGALQDHRRALIVGTTSFGKGSVQNILPLTNGGAVKLTTAFYYTPSGRTIQKQGIKPDVLVEQLVDFKSIQEEGRFKESNYLTAIDIKKAADPLDSPKEKVLKSLPSSQTPNQNRQDAKLTPLKKKASLFDQNDVLKPVKDYQLDQALNILKALSFLEEKKIKG